MREVSMRERRYDFQRVPDRPEHTWPRLADILRKRIVEWRRRLRRFRSEAELRRKLECHNDHLLRDMGLVREGERLERIHNEPSTICVYRRSKHQGE